MNPGLGGNMTLLFKNIFLRLLIASMCFVSLGCGDSLKSSKSVNDDLDWDLGDDDDDDDDGSYTNGAGVYLRNLHSDISTDYKRVYFHADLGDVAGAKRTAKERQGGSIILTFEDSRGRKTNRFFSTAGSTYQTLENNFWTTKKDGDPMWRGIFQGEYGALIMIVDGVYTQGDGYGANDTMAGSLWFRRWQVLSNNKLITHNCTINSQGLWDCKNQSAPLRQCWYVSRGPYDCRFKISLDGKLVSRLANSSNDTEWVKIGTFKNLSMAKTFHLVY